MDLEEAVVVATEAAKVVKEATVAPTEEDPTVDLTAEVLVRTAVVLAATVLALEATISLQEATEVLVTVLRVATVVVPEATVVPTRVLTEATALEAMASHKVQAATANKLEDTVASRAATLLSLLLLVALKAATLVSSLTVSSLSLATAPELVQDLTAPRATATLVATAETPLATKRNDMLAVGGEFYRFLR